MSGYTAGHSITDPRDRRRVLVHHRAQREGTDRPTKLSLHRPCGSGVPSDHARRQSDVMKPSDVMNPEITAT
jgi:hypothetical protein